MAKYEFLACFGDQYDYEYEEVGESNHWKDARNAYSDGAIVYCGNERVYFIDHETVDDAFATLAMYYKMTSNMHFSEDYLEFEDEVRIKDAQDTLEKNGFKLEPDGYPDEAWRGKIMKRAHAVCYDPLTVPLKERLIPIETDELPF